MRYDVFIVSAQADLDAADAIARRLRALKFKVRLDKKRAHVTATPKDIKDLNDAQSVMVLWSKAACNSDKPDSNWIYALAHQARSREGVLIEAGLDKTVPDEPFDKGQRYLLSGLEPRKIVKPFLAMVDELGSRSGRHDLTDWLTSDRAGKDKWKADHPNDPLALASKTKAVAPAPTQTAKPVTAARAKKAPPLVMTPPAVSSQKQAQSAQDDIISTLMLIAISTGIALLFLASYFVRSQPRVETIAIGNASLSNVLICETGERLTCPTPILETGPIIDDTDD
ncbi:MAG: hypothetical protein Hens3KO_25510 [Henriciella sp.]